MQLIEIGRTQNHTGAKFVLTRAGIYLYNVWSSAYITNVKSCLNCEKWNIKNTFMPLHQEISVQVIQNLTGKSKCLIKKTYNFAA